MKKRDVQSFLADNGKWVLAGRGSGGFADVSGSAERSSGPAAVCSGVGYWYYLSFISKNGEEIVSLGIQNSRFLRKDISQGCAAFYNCDGELGSVTDYLESIENIQFPDYKKDRDFDGKYCE